MNDLNDNPDEISKEQFGEILFDTIKAFAGRAEVRKQAHHLAHQEQTAALTRRLADLAQREQDLTKIIDERFNFLDPDDQARLLHDYEQVPDGV